MTRPDWQRKVMRRVGSALIAMGVLDIGVCAVALAHRDNYSSSLNIFALVGGIMIYRGHLGAVRLVVSMFSFMLGGFFILLPVGLLAWLLAFILGVIPPTEMWRFVVGGISSAALLAVCYWIRQSLASLPVFEDGRPARSLMRTPEAIFGVGLVLLLTIVLASVGIYTMAN